MSGKVSRSASHSGRGDGGRTEREQNAPSHGRSQGPFVSDRTIHALVTAAFRLPDDALARSTRSAADIAIARQVAVYIAHVWLGLSLGEVGRRFGRDRTTVAHACRVIEENRDDPDFDRVLNCIEYAVEACGQFDATNTCEEAA